MAVTTVLETHMITRRAGRSMSAQPTGGMHSIRIAASSVPSVCSRFERNGDAPLHRYPWCSPSKGPPTSGEAPRRSQRVVTGSGSGEVVGMRSNHQAAAVGFDTGAEAYERGRPGFPAEAVERLVGELRIEAD